MDAGTEPSSSASGKIVRDREIDGIRLVTVRYPPGTERLRSNCPDGQFWLMLGGGWRSRITGRNEAQCDALSLSYHTPGEKNRRFVGRHGAALFGIQIRNWRLTTNSIHPSSQEPILQEKGPAGRLALRIFRSFLTEEPTDFIRIEEMIAELCLASNGKSLPQLKADEPGWIARVREMLHERHTEPLTLRTIADIAGIHPVYLTAAFRRRFGCSVGEYLRRIRIETALQRICKTEDEMSVIALDAGFYDQAHFNRIFKAQLGFAPGQLRRLTRNL